MKIMAEKDDLRPYQEDALESLFDTPGPFNSLVMPTGSGKTRVALMYADQKMEEINSIAYVVKSDAHVQQVLDEANIIDVEAVQIPGRTSSTAPDEVMENRPINIQDFDAGMKVGVFSYPGYFLGSGVPNADILIIDDAHALVSQDISYSVVQLHRDDWGRQYDRILDLLKEQNPVLKPEVEALERPVHRGGETVLIPPPSTDEVEEAISESVQALTEGTGWSKYILSERLDAAPEFLNWPCVVTADSICWRPFILPFESFGEAPHRKMSENEILALTSMEDSEEFLQLRLGTSRSINQAKLTDDPPEMGSRIVIPYRELRSSSPPNDSQLNIIELWARRFGSVLVSVASDHSYGKLAGEIDDEISVSRFKSPRSVDHFDDQNEPRVLGLVNRPSGIDIPSEICNTAIHLDLPYSTSGHEVIAGDIEESGTVADASLAVRISQLLGRLNRDPDDRSAHVVLADELPLRRGSVFAKSLDPAVLIDLLIGQRGIAREYRLPDEEELLNGIEAFLQGDDEFRERFIADQEKLRERFIGSDVENFSPSTDVHVEANLYAARGNFTEAAKEFASFSRDAEAEDFTAHASFYDFQSLTYGQAEGVDTVDVLGREPESIIDSALNRNPPSSSLVAALRQMRSTEDIDPEKAQEQLVRLEQKQQAQARFIRWRDEVEPPAPTGTDATELDAWKQYWRSRIRSPHHQELVDAYSDMFELLGTDSPQFETANNDVSIAWRSSPENTFTLAMEMKGWNDDERDEPPDLTTDYVEQARDNANSIDADAVLLVTSRRSRHREVPSVAENLGVYYLLQEAGVAFADLIAEQSVTSSRVQQNIGSVNDLPYDAVTFFGLFADNSGGEIDTHDVQNLSE